MIKNYNILRMNLNNTIVRAIIIPCLVLVTSSVSAQKLPPIFDKETQKQTQYSELTHSYLAPTRIVWKSAAGNAEILNEEKLLKIGTGQADLIGKDICIMKSDGTSRPAIVLDFGKEINGGIRIVTGTSPTKKVKIRVRFGESVSETMSDVGGKDGATNDHAIRDMVVELPWMGRAELGNTGFRFVRIDLLEDNSELHLKEVNAEFVYRDIPYIGSFNCSDDLLNKIWLTGAYTVHLNMQEYVWDGIKRDRLVWIGDIHPEISTINVVFGYNNSVPRSLDQARDITPMDKWMNGISSYSMWWIISQHDWYMNQGDLKYLKQQKEYLAALLKKLSGMVDQNTGSEKLDGHRFLDWPSSENKDAIHAGLQSLMIQTFEKGAFLSRQLNNNTTATLCDETLSKLRKYTPSTINSKQAAALLTLSGTITPDAGNKMISENGVHDFSTFYGYYMLQAMAAAGNYEGAMTSIRDYWGAMLSVGATTFWEDFNINWLENASPIDEPVQPGKIDIHGNYGDYCYVGLRHSLCHGWASGPTAWLSQHVLGIQVLEPGCKKIKIEPHLGNLTFAEGSYPTPHGVITVRHTKDAAGKVKSEIKAPKEIKIVK